MSRRRERTELTPGTVLDGKYTLERMLGEGGMGAVYLATHGAIGRRVAIKMLSSEFADNETIVARFRLEARAAAIIGHPGIVDVFDIGELDGNPYIVMEYLEGRTLGERLHEKKRLDAPEAIEIVSAVLDALAAAHGAGIVHRDLKPGNIFIVEKPVPAIKILDFGISKFRGLEDLSLTKTGVSMGTANYMPPEQIRDSRDVSPASDLYSVGAILYKVLTGRPPFAAEAHNEVIARVLTTTHVPAIQLRPELPLALSRLIDALLEKVRDRRPGDALAVRELLRRSLHDDATAIDDHANAHATEETRSPPTKLERPESLSTRAAPDAVESATMPIATDFATDAASLPTALEVRKRDSSSNESAAAKSSAVSSVSEPEPPSVAPRTLPHERPAGRRWAVPAVAAAVVVLAGAVGFIASPSRRAATPPAGAAQPATAATSSARPTNAPAEHPPVPMPTTPPSASTTASAGAAAREPAKELPAPSIASSPSEATSPDAVEKSAPDKSGKKAVAKAARHAHNQAAPKASSESDLTLDRKAPY